jgi:hypothetical protein
MDQDRTFQAEPTEPYPGKERLRLILTAREMTALYETSPEINTQPNLATLLNTIVQRAKTLLGTQGGLLLLKKPGEQGLEVAANLQPDDFLYPKSK